MDITKISKLESLDRADFPEELYDIKPNQILYFIPLEGFNLKYLDSIRDDILHIYLYLQELHKDDVDVRIVPTDKKLLIDSFAGRCAHSVDAPYDVVLGTKDTIAGFASYFFGDDIEKVVNTLISIGIRRHLSISATNLPVIVKIDPNDKPIRKSATIVGESSEDVGIELLTKRPETQKEKDELIAKREDKLRKLLWECAYLGIDLDVKGIADEMEAIKNQPTDGYQLSLKIKPISDRLFDCHIFVREGEELKLKPVWKAVYLTFLSLEKGIKIETATQAFTKRIQKIYNFLPDKSLKEEENDGLLYVDHIQSKTLRGYMSFINNEIAKHIPNGIVMLEFAIEGEKEGDFRVLRSTPEIREQIVTAFNL